MYFVSVSLFDYNNLNFKDNLKLNSNKKNLHFKLFILLRAQFAFTFAVPICLTNLKPFCFIFCITPIQNKENSFLCLCASFCSLHLHFFFVYFWFVQYTHACIKYIIENFYLATYSHSHLATNILVLKFTMQFLLLFLYFHLLLNV